MKPARSVSTKKPCGAMRLRRASLWWLVMVLLAAGCAKGESKAKPQRSADRSAAKAQKLQPAEQQPVAVQIVRARLSHLGRKLELVGSVTPEAEVRILPKVTGR
ncbi:MAG: hypothetical protein HY692_10030, partial [Cyanobacteria bacterium NC_groundwater_1444_Ag_S-0.65um_54_12]|nr:hypothetical protein [Cyanobacteria bacterium NC_groundwater_1444_Ag_S-0.65um_54_12]